MPGGRILVVDRDLEVCRTLSQALEADGYAVQLSHRGSEALDLASAAPPDAIVVDVMMSGRSGRRFLTALREDLGMRDIPVLIMTSIPGIDPGRAIAMGASDVVAKPFEPEEVLNKLALALFRTRQERCSPSEEIVLAQLEALQAEADANGKGLVMIVSDDRSSLRHRERLFRESGYWVVSLAEATEEMVRLARVLEPLAIVIDLVASEPDDPSAVRQLRSETLLDSIPILFLVERMDKLRTPAAEFMNLGVAVRLRSIGDEELVSFVSDPPPTAWRRNDMI